MWVGTSQGLYHYDFYHDNFHSIPIIDEKGNERQLTTLERRLMFDKLRDLNNQDAQLQNQIGGLRASISGS